MEFLVEVEVPARATEAVPWMSSLKVQYLGIGQALDASSLACSKIWQTYRDPLVPVFLEQPEGVLVAEVLELDEGVLGILEEVGSVS